MQKIGFAADSVFIDRLDAAVISYRRAHPERNTSRSAFMRLALERLMAEQAPGGLRVRQRTTNAA